MTHKSVKYVRPKHRLFQRYRDVSNPKYAEAAKKLTEIRRAKRKFEKKLAENIKSDNKSFLHMPAVVTKAKLALVQS